jgi:Raf kinase inhibitor-like YbhB/YbcL family protein
MRTRHPDTEHVPADMDMPASRRLWRRSVAAVALATAACVVAACSDDGRAMREPTPDQNLSIITTTTLATDDSSAAGIGTGLPSLPIESAVEGSVAATTAPADATTAGVDSGPLSGFAITAPWADGGVIDATYTCTGTNAAPTLLWAQVPPDAAELAVVVVDPDAGNFVHWVVAGINPGITGIIDGQVPDGAVQGQNGFGSVGWGGPCPPAGESHAYRFEVHALSQPSGLTDGAAGDGMLRVIDGDTLEVAVNIGNFPGA